MKKQWITITLFNFFIAACMGLLLRYAHLVELEWMDFRKMMHAHSHVAMLGWAFLACYFLIWLHFLPNAFKKQKLHNRLFWLFQLTVLGMAISFPIQGYALYSITFSTLHVLLAYYWVYKIWNKLQHKNNQAVILIKTALVLMIFSTLGLYVLGASMAGSGKNLTLYHAAIQFFLHFQFNGWFTFAVLAFLFSCLKPKIDSNFKWFYAFLVVSCLFTYALSVTWSNPDDKLFLANGVGVCMQLLALFYLLRILHSADLSFYYKHSKTNRLLLLLALFSFVMKILVQSAVIVPQVAVISYTIRLFVIGFIHLTMLGSVSIFLIVEFNRSVQTKTNTYIKGGALLLAIGFLTTELLLFTQGLFLWLSQGFFRHYYESIFAFSLLLPLALIVLYIGYYKIKDKNIQNNFKT